MFQYVMPPYVGYHVAHVIYGAIETHVDAPHLIGDTSISKIGPFRLWCTVAHKP